MKKPGLYLAKRSINKSNLARKISVTKQEIDPLVNNERSKLLVSEAYLTALALKVNPEEFIKVILN